MLSLEYAEFSRINSPHLYYHVSVLVVYTIMLIINIGKNYNLQILRRSDEVFCFSNGRYSVMSDKIPKIHILVLNVLLLSVYLWISLIGRVSFANYHSMQDRINMLYMCYVCSFYFKIKMNISSVFSYLQHRKFFLCWSSDILSVSRCCNFLVFTCVTNSNRKPGPTSYIHKW